MHPAAIEANHLKTVTVIMLSKIEDGKANLETSVYIYQL